ncbi:hypothetical protein Drorol1_Dr00020167 [Drosera rotundifolia]
MRPLFVAETPLFGLPLFVKSKRRLGGGEDLESEAADRRKEEGMAEERRESEVRTWEPYVLLRIVEVLHSAYKAGHVPMADHISFFITLVSKFEVSSGQAHTVLDSEAKISRQATLRQMYPVEECGNSNYTLRSRYYLLPCYLLFDRSIKLLMLVLNKLEVFATQLDATPLSHPAQLDSHHWRRITMVVAVFLMISKDDKLRDVLSSCRDEMYHLMQSVLSIQSKEEASMSIEQKLKANCAIEQLKTAISEISP